MADRAQQLILTALSQSLGHGEPVALHGSRTRPGLFPSNAAGKQAAQKCRQEGWITENEVGCAISETGMQYLLAQVSPRQVLDDLVRALEARHEELDRLVRCVHQMQASLEGLRANAERVLAHLENPLPIPGQEGAPPLNQLFGLFQNGQQPATDSRLADCAVAILDCLTTWPTGANEDCSLPTLYDRVVSRVPGLTVGAFQDVLRELERAGRIYLHPWTGPLYAMPEPTRALLVGHEVAYYASLRRSA